MGMRGRPGCAAVLVLQRLFRAAVGNLCFSVLLHGGMGPRNTDELAWSREMMFRSPKLLAMAKEAPVCFGCGKANDGDVVAAHANWSEYGKVKVA